MQFMYSNGYLKYENILHWKYVASTEECQQRAPQNGLLNTYIMFICFMPLQILI